MRTACDRCVQLKTKCDNQNPCQRCASKSQRCEYTRDETSDSAPLGDFDGFEGLNNSGWQAQVQFPSGAKTMHSAHLQTMESVEALQVSTHASATDSITAASCIYDNFQNATESSMWPDFLEMSLGLNLDGIAWQCEPSNGWDNTSTEIGSGYYMDTPSDGQNTQQITGQSRSNLTFSSRCEYCCVFRLTTEQELTIALLDPELIDNTTKVPSLLPNCFLLAQIDPVEAKCKELNDLLCTNGNRIKFESSNQCITRGKLVQSIELFGRHFQRHLPIIHTASFNLYEAPRGLLMAMYCVGACYGGNIMTNQDLLKAAMQVLTDIEAQPVSIRTRLNSI